MVIKKFIFCSVVCLTALFVCGFYLAESGEALAKQSDICHMGDAGSSQDACFDCQKNASTTMCSCSYVGENSYCSYGSGSGRCFNGSCSVCKETDGFCNYDSDCCGTLGCLNWVCSADRPSVTPVVPSTPFLSKEMDCCDGIDNDGDSLVDNQDSDCSQVQCEQKIAVSIAVLNKNNNQPIVGIKVEMNKTMEGVPYFSCQTGQDGSCSMEIPTEKKYSVRMYLNSAEFKLDSYSIDNQKVLAPSSPFEIFVLGNSFELKIFVKDLRGIKCSLCGQGFFNICDEQECLGLSECSFAKKLVGGQCLPKDLAGFCECQSVYQPVCGKDGMVYQNLCQIQCLKVEPDYEGECRQQATTLAGIAPKLFDCAKGYGAPYGCLSRDFWKDYCGQGGNSIYLENGDYCLDEKGVKRDICGRCGPEDYFVFTLVPGWNTISFPLLPSLPSIKSVFAPISQSIGSLKTYDNLTKKQITLDINSVSSVELSKGYLVFINGNKNAQLEIQGKKLSSLASQDFTGIFNLTKGSNLISVPFTSPVEIKDINFIDQCSQIIYFSSGDLSSPINQTKAIVYNCQDQSGSFSDLKPGRAYWVDVSQEKSVKVNFKVVLLDSKNQETSVVVPGATVKAQIFGLTCQTNQAGLCSLSFDLNQEYQAIAQKEGHTCNLQGICWKSFTPKDLGVSKEVVLPLQKKSDILSTGKYLCVDPDASDNSSDIFFKSVVSLFGGGSVSQLLSQRIDLCQNGKLTEYFCKTDEIGDLISYKDTQCLFGCNGDGACQRPERLATFQIKDQKSSEPVVGAKIEIFPARSLQKITECQTNSNGMCFISLLEQNDFVAFVSADGYHCADNQTIFGCQKDFSLEAKSISISFALQKNNEPFCSDSDNGKNPNIKGAAIINGSTISSIDTCLTSGDSKSLQEYFCSQNNLIESAIIVCSEKCENGKCVITLPPLGQDLTFAQSEAKNLGSTLFRVNDKKVSVSIDKKGISHSVFTLTPVLNAEVKVMFEGDSQVLASCKTDDKGQCRLYLPKGAKYFAYVEKDGKVCSQKGVVQQIGGAAFLGSCLVPFEIPQMPASYFVSLQFLSNFTELASQAPFVAPSLIIVPPVATSTVPAVNYCSNCGTNGILNGLLNLCGQAGCLSLGDCLYIKKLIGGTCVEKSKCMCAETSDLVCGSDKQTYPNACLAGCAKVKVSHTGSCSLTPLPEKIVDCKKEISNLYWCSSYEKWQKDCNNKGEAILQDIACNSNGDKYCSTCHQCPNGDIDCSTSMDYIKGKTAKCDMKKGECYYEENKCVDSDNGKNYFQVGTTSVGGLTFTDYCTENNLTYESLLHEGYCENNQFKEETHPCITECRLGACVPGITNTQFQSAVSIEAGGTVELSNGQGKARLIVPAGAVKEPATVKILLKPVSDSAGKGTAISSGQNIMGGYVYDFTMVNQAGNEIKTFDKPIKVEIYYTDEQVAGVSENDLTIRYYNEAQQKWVALKTERDTTKNFLWAEMSHFSLYAIESVYAGETAVFAPYVGECKDFCDGKVKGEPKGVTCLCNPTGWDKIEDIIASITNKIFYVVAFMLAPLMILIGAFYLMTAGGSPARSKKGRDFIMYAVIGLAIVLFARAILGIVKDVLGVKPTP